MLTFHCSLLFLPLSFHRLLPTNHPPPSLSHPSNHWEARPGCTAGPWLKFLHTYANLAILSPPSHLHIPSSHLSTSPTPPTPIGLPAAPSVDIVHIRVLFLPALLSSSLSLPLPRPSFSQLPPFVSVSSLLQLLHSPGALR